MMPKARIRMPLLETIQYNGQANIRAVEYFFAKVKDSKKLVKDTGGQVGVICQYCEWSKPGLVRLNIGDYILRDLEGKYKVLSEIQYLEKYEEVRE